jgi:glutamyl-tRNA reductase
MRVHIPAGRTQSAEVMSMNPSSKRLVVCGVTHQTSTVEEREPLQIGADELARANIAFAKLPHVTESTIVCTCNRVEFYFVTRRDSVPLDIVADFYREYRGLDLEPYRRLFETRKSTHAAEHLFRVATGIDSMVVGETQIFGQIKDSYASACAVKAAGKVIHRLFHQAFRVGKQVRTDTEMGKGACSVSTAAVELLKSKLSIHERPVILFVGINQMIKLAAARCGRLHHSKYIFANRTVEKAVEFAERFEAEGFGLDKLGELLAQADVAITCTSSPEPIINHEMIMSAMKERNGERLIMLDLAIPRDVDFPKGERDGVEVLDLEDIKAFVSTQMVKREEAIPQAEEIIKQKLDEFNYWWQHVREEPLYNGHGDTLTSIVDDELSPLLEQCPAELKEQLNQAARRIAERVARTTGGGAVN